jgi:hypothetical protein
VTSATTNRHVISRLSPRLSQPSVGGDGSAVSRTEVVVDAFFTSRNESAVVHAEVRNPVDQELPFINPVRVEEAACRIADVPPLMSAALVSLLAVGTGLSIILPPGCVAAMVLAEGGCSVTLGGDLMPGRTRCCGGSRLARPGRGS